MRRGVLIKKQFPDLKHGGTEAALAKAVAFRDQVLQEMTPYTCQEQRAIVRKSNTTGIPGLHYVKSASGCETWIARIRLPNGKNKTRSFAVSKYGDKARDMAIMSRMDMLAEIEGHFLLGEEARKATSAVLPQIKAQVPEPELAREAKPQEIGDRYKNPTLSGQPGVLRTRVVKRDSVGNITSDLAYWHASYRAGGIRKSSYFRIKPDMEEEAFRLAMAQRAAWEAEFGPANRSRQSVRVRDDDE